MKRIVSLLILAITSLNASAQIDSSLLRRVDVDTSQEKLNMDAIFNRPFLNVSKTPVSLGGYINMNYQHLGTDGVSDGHEFQFRRMSIFMSSSISRHVKFLTEIEFENDKDEQLEGKPMEIEIEYAAVDVEFNSLLNLRTGIILNPIGAFNQNHDDPKWEFTDRPIAMTQMLPDVLSSPGFGLYGKHYDADWMIGYEAYLTNGLDNSIIDNDKNKTYLPQATENPARFSSSFSGSPMFTGKLGLRHAKVAEIGLSYMNGVYNQWSQAGVEIDDKRRLSVFDIDFNASIARFGTQFVGEWAWINVQLPTDYFEQFGSRQRGGFMDIIQPIYQNRVFGWPNAQVNLALRAEYVDWNVGRFASTEQNIADDLWSIMPGISFRPQYQTILRLNYRYMQQRDIIGNPPSLTGGFILGLATYF